MTKNELAREVSVSEKLHISTTVKAIDGTLRVIKEALAKGEVVIIRGFGTFTPVEVAERTAHNFNTGKPLAKEYIIKRKLMLHVHGIRIKEV